MKVRHRQPARLGLFIFTAIWLIVVLPLSVRSAPYAAMVIDARNGEVLHSENADTRLHPASLTKMMTLYVAFQAIERGEISLDTVVTVPAAAAAEPPSKLGLRAGQKIKLRYLIRAAAIKSANDAAHAIGTRIIDQSPRRPRGIVQYRLVPLRRRIMDRHRLGRCAKTAQAIMVVGRVKALEMDDCRTAHRVLRRKASAMFTGAIIIGDRPPLGIGFDGDPVGPQRV